MRSLLGLCALALMSGCYMSHTRPVDGFDAGDLGFDAGPQGFDAGPQGFDAGPPRLDAGAPDACIGPGCELIAELDGLRWELPCTTPGVDSVCETLPAVADTIPLRGGEPGARYAVELRFRGVVETAEYRGGVDDAPFYIGGDHYGGAWNLYALDVSSPRQTYFLNAGPEGRYVCVAIDYVRTVEIDTGANLTLRADAIEGRQIVNVDAAGQPIVIEGVPPDPEPFDGQLIQMDVVSIRRVR